VAAHPSGCPKVVGCGPGAAPTTTKTSDPPTTDRSAGDPAGDGTGRSVARWLLGGGLAVAGIGHLTFQRDEFQAQVPGWFPVDADAVVVVSGVVEIVLGGALILAGRNRVLVGWIAAAFFVVIFPGNVAQWLEGTDAFGLDTDTARFVRLFFQPVLIVWALWSTGAWSAWRRAGREAVRPAGIAR
jgi:uncharacterized membrane protein